MRIGHEQKPPGRKRPGVSFLLAFAGLSLVVAGSDLLVHSKASGPGWVLLPIGLALTLCAVLLAAGRL